MAGHWVDDTAEKQCQSCWTLFSFSNRRHHCRDCGGIFCHTCTNNTLPIPYRHSGSSTRDKPVRVCHLCAKFATLQKKIVAVQEATLKAYQKERGRAPQVNDEIEQWMARDGEEERMLQETAVRGANVGLGKRLSGGAEGSSPFTPAGNASFIPATMKRQMPSGLTDVPGLQNATFAAALATPEHLRNRDAFTAAAAATSNVDWHTFLSPAAEEKLLPSALRGLHESITMLCSQAAVDRAAEERQGQTNIWEDENSVLGFASYYRC